ncbi:hypothetical protein [Urechidicola croceus]|uniref:Uncharacterized protein n=1 Tax=Urechidicola croceus TaxID=1850246 RepID=A0A1D8P4E0_9FLAO|nr:hypothetical protein [Urechidicola croceus]AOW19427.1 hypothetical protein LPB138_01435 [Urechidicola croceus]
MKKNVSTTIFILFTIVLFGQKNIEKLDIYSNENKEIISINEFNTKCKNVVFHCKKYETDSLIINKVLYRYYFGEISKQENKQVRIYLNRLANKDIDTTKNIIIYFKERLVGFNQSIEECTYDVDKSIQENYSIYLNNVTNQSHNEMSLLDFKKVFNNHITKFHSEVRYYDDYEKTAKTKSKCIQKIEKKSNSKINLIVHENIGYKLKNDYFTWAEDTGVIKNMFFEINTGNDLLILKPNGKYFIKNGYVSDSNIIKIANESDWSEYYNDWKKTTEEKFSKGHGIIKKLVQNNVYHLKHCF